MSSKASRPDFSSPTPRVFREGLSRFASGVTVITARGKKGEAPVGVTISSFAALSLQPPLVLFCLDEKSRLRPAFAPGASFAVHVLAEDQKKLAKFFSVSGTHRWKKIAHKMQGGVPLLDGVSAILLCQVETLLSGGDHRIIVGRVKKIAVNKEVSRPLLHGQRKYWGLGKAR